MLGIGSQHGYDPAAAEGRKLYELIGAAVYRYLFACFRDGPGLVVAEDVHWFDASTIEVLEHLLASAEGRLLVVITGRDGAWFSLDWPATVFDLSALDEHQCDELIQALDPAVTADELASVRHRCDGMPLYIEQIVAGLHITSASELPAVPEPLYEPLFARLRASPNAVPVVEAAAVIGRNVDRDLLIEVSGLAADQLDLVSKELEDAMVFESCEGGWRFRHELLREVAAELAPPTVRKRLHGAVADALIEHAAGEPDWRLVASHCEQAERFDDSAAAYQRAATDARRRGALAEALSYLSQGISHLDQVAPGTDRDQREIALRLERALLTAAAEGAGSLGVAADAERCLQIGGSNLPDDQLFATFGNLIKYYNSHADLRRTTHLIDVMGPDLERGRQWFRPVIDGWLGNVAFLRGEFESAQSGLEIWKAGLASAYDQIDAVWFMPSDPQCSMHLPLAFVRFIRGDLDGAELELAGALSHAEKLPFPKGPFSLAYTCFGHACVSIESGQYERAASLAADMVAVAEQHGFESWRFIGAAVQASVGVRALVESDAADPVALSPHIATLSMFVDTCRALALNLYVTFFDGMLGHALCAAGEGELARRRLDAGLELAEQTGMRFYDAELLRLRARTETEPTARTAGFAAAIELARAQGAHLVELRAALDDFDERGPAALIALEDAISHMPPDSSSPEVASAHARLGSAH